MRGGRAIGEGRDIRNPGLAPQGLGPGNCPVAWSPRLRHAGPPAIERPGAQSGILDPATRGAFPRKPAFDIDADSVWAADSLDLMKCQSLDVGTQTEPLWNGTVTRRSSTSRGYRRTRHWRPMRRLPQDREIAQLLPKQTTVRRSVSHCRFPRLAQPASSCRGRAPN